MLWLDKGACTLGRATGNTHVLDLPGISRSHAMLQPGPTGGYLLADLKSTNGTYLNGLRIEQVVPLRRTIDQQVAHVQVADRQVQLERFQLLFQDFLEALLEFAVRPGGPE